MLNINEKVELGYKHNNELNATMQISLLSSARALRADLLMDKTNHTYTTNKQMYPMAKTKKEQLKTYRIINIGLDTFQAMDENEFLIWTMFLICHETGHIKHTTDKAWTFGLSNGVIQMCTVMSEILEGPGKRRFIKDTDVDNFCAFLQKNGYQITKDLLKNLAHMVQNSLEDGRIERIDAKHSTAFRNRMKFCRGRQWQVSALTREEAESYLAGDKQAELSIILGQILSIATTGLYQRNFFDFLPIDDKLVEFIDNLTPYIKDAVGAGTCRKCIDTAIEIEKILAPLLLEASKSSSSSMSKELEELLQKLLEEANASEDANPSTQMNQEETEEDEDGEGMEDIFGTGSFGSTPEDGEDTKASGNGSGKPSEEGKGDGAGKSNESMEINGERDLSSAGDTNDGKGDGAEMAGCVYDHKSQRITKRNHSDSAGDVSDFNAVDAAVKAAMEDAKLQASGLIGAMIEQANKPLKQSKPQFKKTGATVNVNDCKKLLDKKYDNVHFDEKKRIYDLSVTLPSELQSRADRFQNEIKDLLHNKRTTLSGLKSGKLDSNSLYKLLVGEVNMFYREGDPKDFDGCCYILQDNSGSMGRGRGSKRTYACEATAIMEQGFKDLMPIKIAAFDAMGSNYVQHEVVKEFEETDPRSYAYNFLVRGRAGNGNKDGYSIRIATQQILARPEEKKLLVILSDGAPSDYSGGFNEGYKDVHDAVIEAKQAGIIVVAIYFSDYINEGDELKEYEMMYGNDYIATTPNNIEKQLISLMKTFYFE